MFPKKMTGACNLSKKDYLPLSTEAKKKGVEQISLQIAQGGFNMVFSRLNLF